MKRFLNCSYRMQIFFMSVLLIAVPSILLSVFTVMRTLQQVDSRYQDSLLDLTTQINLNVNTLIENAEKIGTLHIINDDVCKILKTNYGANPSEYYSSDLLMKAQILQANRLNTSVITSVFLNKYGYSFDYNFNTYSDFRDIFKNIDQWAQLARSSPRSTYVAPIQHPKRKNIAYQNILPLVKILKDPQNFSEIGVFGIGINFDSVTDILSSSRLPNSTILFFNQDNKLLFVSDDSFPDAPDSGELMSQLTALSSEITAENTNDFRRIRSGQNAYSVNTLYNRPTGWKIVHLLDNSIVDEASRMSIRSFTLIFFAILGLELLLAYFISHQLSKTINHLCRQIDESENGLLHPLNLNRQMLSSKEFHKIVDSYNRLNKRLMDSLTENYTIQLNEKQMKFKMLQAQINPHFLYNTLNLISSIANIRGVPEIRTISAAISDLLRYNLKSGPIVTLREEACQAERYIAIQQIRFPDKFVYECTLPEELASVTVPVFILQPLVENALLHGLDEKEGGGSILINIYGEFDCVRILIADNGIGIEPHEVKKLQESLISGSTAEIMPEQSSIGLLNVHQRIQAFCGREYGLSVDSTVGQGTIVDIRLPNTRNLKPL